MTTFGVTLRGRRAAADQAETVARLASLLGRSSADAERALAMPSLTVKRGVDLRPTAIRTNVSQRGPGLFSFWRDVAKARRIAEQALAPFRR